MFRVETVDILTEEQISELEDMCNVCFHEQTDNTAYFRQAVGEGRMG